MQPLPPRRGRIVDSADDGQQPTGTFNGDMGQSASEMNDSALWTWLGQPVGQG